MSDEKKPWRWESDESGKRLVDGDGRPVLDIDHDPWDVHSEGEDSVIVVGEADARLIAAAPEMAALLRELSTRCFDGEQNETVDGQCALCGHDPMWPKRHPTHRPDCRLAALLARLDGR